MSKTNRFFTELEGIRGYAFLLVFFTHYLLPEVHHRRWTVPIRLMFDLSWVAVPVFFTLSGFLITNVLLRTRERQGYFKVFYFRRAIRVLPLYYGIVLAIGLAGLAAGAFPAAFFWSHLFYVQNLDTRFLQIVQIGRVRLTIGHFWSLALEEQFYLVWPLVVWFCRSRRALAAVCVGGTVLCSIIRFEAPKLGISPVGAYFHTATRADSVLLGALLALAFGRPVYATLERWALPVIAGGYAALTAAFFLHGSSCSLGRAGDASGNWRVWLMTPIVNFTALALTVLAMKEGGRFQAVCRNRLMCRLGAISYGCYAIHQLFLESALFQLIPYLQPHMPYTAAVLLVTGGSLALTIAVAAGLYRWVEQPAMGLKRLLPYGPEVTAKPLGSWSDLAGRPRDLWSGIVRKGADRSAHAGSSRRASARLDVRSVHLGSTGLGLGIGSVGIGSAGMVSTGISSTGISSAGMRTSGVRSVR